MPHFRETLDTDFDRDPTTFPTTPEPSSDDGGFMSHSSSPFDSRSTSPNLPDLTPTDDTLEDTWDAPDVLHRGLDEVDLFLDLREAAPGDEDVTIFIPYHTQPYFGLLQWVRWRKFRQRLGLGLKRVTDIGPATAPSCNGGTKIPIIVGSLETIGHGIEGAQLRAAFDVTGGREWGISLALGVVSIPLGAIIRLLPGDPFERLFKTLGLLSRPDVLPTTTPNPDTVGWNAITRVRDNLNTFANVRGGRVRSSSFVIKSRTARLSQEKECPV
ncbi:hypothetical protein B0H13DRAFT_2337883 [Mycena leptocephala]|nr:hypothetical protein B0H13DRAFT_2337883 [Mycena leptocephala]